MNRTWWEHLQHVAPKALAECTTRFATKYPRDWRRRIQELDELDQYFYENHKLELHVSQVNGGVYPFGYRLIGKGWKVSRSKHYATSEEARWSALFVTFQLLEAESRRVQFVNAEVHKPMRRQEKGGGFEGKTAA